MFEALRGKKSADRILYKFNKNNDVFCFDKKLPSLSY